MAKIWENDLCTYTAYLSTWYTTEERLIPGYAIGVDPGTEFGITIFPWQGHVLSLSGKLRDMPGELHRGYTTFHIMKNILLDRLISVNHTSVVVEGASFGDTYGQVKLAENRAGFCIGALEMQAMLHVVPPATIRKEVLGHGRVSGKELYFGMNKNAADSIPMCLLAGTYFTH